MKTYTFFNAHNLITRNHYNFLKTFWAIHMTLYRVYCIEYNAMIYCVFRIPNVFRWHSNNLIAWNQYNFLKTYWLIHMTLYRVSCIEYTWLFENAQFYAVLCISYSKCILTTAFKQFDSTKPTLFLKNIWKYIIHIFFIHIFW